jgi:hypothetical protein
MVRLKKKKGNYSSKKLHACNTAGAQELFADYIDRMCSLRRQRERLLK